MQPPSTLTCPLSLSSFLFSFLLCSSFQSACYLRHSPRGVIFLFVIPLAAIIISCNYSLISLSFFIPRRFEQSLLRKSKDKLGLVATILLSTDHISPTCIDKMDSLSVLAMAAAAAPRSQIAQAAADFTIRKARKDDLPLLGPIERSAAELFRTVGLDFLTYGPTMDESLLSAMSISNHLWVAVNEVDQPIGFAGGEELAGNFHIAEISVSQDAQGKGVGKALMGELMRQAKEEGYPAVTLTTYRNLPWNGPWYHKLGFSEMKVDEMEEKYATIWDSEAQHGHDMNLRCIMRKNL